MLAGPVVCNCKMPLALFEYTRPSFLPELSVILTAAVISIAAPGEEDQVNEMVDICDKWWWQR